ncbi:hypothetical protein EMGBD4_14470 [Verrucomicrobiota bacterium]|nr:hypothetical protein EMGBD4_14470 [Verrucomicrobiota bacterium]
MIGVQLDDFFTLNQWQGWHFKRQGRMVFGIIIRVGQAQEFLKAVAGGA